MGYSTRRLASRFLKPTYNTSKALLGFTSFNPTYIFSRVTKRLNARSAVGITREGNILLVMAAQKPELPQNSGVSLPELAELMKSFGVEKAMNLDGGSSSALYYQGETFYGRVNRDGNRIKRPIKSVLVVTP